LAFAGAAAFEAAAAVATAEGFAPEGAFAGATDAEALAGSEKGAQKLPEARARTDPKQREHEGVRKGAGITADSKNGVGAL
jgi:hypothetical protein